MAWEINGQWPGKLPQWTDQSHNGRMMALKSACMQCAVDQRSIRVYRRSSISQASSTHTP
jgi:hypothetical protein